MRVNLTQSNFATKICSPECLTHVLIQAQTGSGTLVLIGKNKTELEDLNVTPRIGLIIDPNNGIYSFCWQGEMWAIAIGGTMFIDWEPNTNPRG